VALSKEEQAQLDALTQKASEPDTDNDFEIEIGSGDKYARVPYHKGRSYLQEHFGIDLDPEVANSGGAESAAEGESGKGKKPAKQDAGTEGSQRTGHWSGRMDRNSA
jgi:hypothetical protein